MRVCSAIAVCITTCLVAGCAAPKRVVWDQAFATNVPHAQALAQCQYEDRLQRNADARVGYQRGALEIVQELQTGMSATVVSCMNRFGYRARFID